MLLYTVDGIIPKSGRIVLPSELDVPAVQAVFDLLKRRVKLNTATGQTPYQRCINLPSPIISLLELPSAHRVQIYSSDVLIKPRAQELVAVNDELPFLSKVEEHKRTYDFNVPSIWGRGMASEGWAMVKCRLFKNDRLASEFTSQVHHKTLGIVRITIPTSALGSLVVGDQITVYARNV